MTPDAFLKNNLGKYLMSIILTVAILKIAIGSLVGMHHSEFVKSGLQVILCAVYLYSEKKVKKAANP